MTLPEHDRLNDLVHETAEIHTLLQQQSERELTHLHRPLERMSMFLSHPGFIVTTLVLFLLWIALNLELKHLGRKPWDEAPFYWLQGLIGLLGLIVTTTVLVGQARQGQLAEQRAQLQLQIVLLTEQRSAKTIALLEELRRDLPNVRNRYDEDAQVMQQVSNPEVILEAIQEGDSSGSRKETS
ncbi:DUF1003 domain-containing protein [Deinococcus hopiensis]|uniref:Uncharacterized membrane protein n=1 Tax=Deinococcus hopiensis KR-140 TaxID=695939 RepID=A0A1W1VCS7_9DEIO|nr:DUF1003 domain-containing protein [Deinococcus hopiensis]SMB91125.1 Uncharacterized membrane protein [Deinococcus hopiensis KR-140]